MGSPGLGVRGFAPLKIRVALLFLQLRIGKSSVRGGGMASGAVVDFYSAASAQIPLKGSEVRGHNLTWKREQGWNGHLPKIQ